MNMIGDTKDAKIETASGACFSTNIYKDAERCGLEFKELYNASFERHNVKQQTEAFHLGISQPTVSQFRNPDGVYHLPAYQVPRSKMKNDLMHYLATEAGGCYTPPLSGLNGSWKDELAAIIKATSEIVKHEDEKERVKAAFEKIKLMACKALEEMK